MSSKPSTILKFIILKAQYLWNIYTQFAFLQRNLPYLSNPLSGLCLGTETDAVEGN